MNVYAAISSKPVSWAIDRYSEGVPTPMSGDSLTLAAAGGRSTS